MAFREGVWENVKSVAGIILSLRRLGTGSFGGNAGGFRARKVEWTPKRVDPKVLARIENQKNQAILLTQRIQIR